MHLYLGQEAWGHVIARLLKDLPEGICVKEELIEKAKVLDNFYIPARYPDSHPIRLYGFILYDSPRSLFLFRKARRVCVICCILIKIVTRTR
nr:HEPN domain-containing protein [Thermosediminibacter litoriperuensis]